MRTIRAIYPLAILLAVTVLSASSAAQQPASFGRDSQLVQQVFARLLAVPAAARPVQRFDTWPPRVAIIDPEHEHGLAEMAGSHNAFAYAPNCIPQVRITDDLMNDVVEGDPDRLALILGHELGHLLLGHTSCSRSADKSPVAAAAFTRAQEFAADRKGVELALAAGYSARNGFKGLQRMAQMSDYSSFEALSKNHPSWPERLAEMDASQARLWRSMSAFQDGVYFLETENYANAERCFRSVVTEFPGAADAWANRGYALLMEYADGLTANDLRGFGIGQIAIGAFYSRPAYLSSKVRGIDAKTWQEAVNALARADQLDPTLALAKANLGVAYLLNPSGKEPRQAIALLEAAAGMLRKDPSIAAQAQSNRGPIVAVVNNLAVAYAAAGQVDEAGSLLQSVTKIGIPRSETGYLQAGAVMYNYAMLLASTSNPAAHKEAHEMLEDYLQNTESSSSWWPMAYERYGALSREMGRPLKTEAELQRSTRHVFREVDSVDMGGGRVITLGQKLGDAARTGWVEVATVHGTRLKRLRSASAGLDVLVDGDQILSIFLRDVKSPALPLRGIGMQAGAAQLRVGMSDADVDQHLKDEPYRYEALADTWVPYRFYPYLGIAIRTGEDRRISELVVVQTARK